MKNDTTHTPYALAPQYDSKIVDATPIADMFFLRKLHVLPLKNSFAIYNDSGDRIASINNKFMRQKDIARLLAASPVLLKALERLIAKAAQAFDAPTCKEIMDACNAVAQATGEGE